MWIIVVIECVVEVGDGFVVGDELLDECVGVGWLVEFGD